MLRGREENRRPSAEPHFGIVFLLSAEMDAGVGLRLHVVSFDSFSFLSFLGRFPQNKKSLPRRVSSGL